ncbi:uncharacterized protein LOC117601009 [Osmia lignaria lignaria]|uniref:uncharacterized protein LOC117601009 n=1 Tax=Osmia lignaria lignaria TaxID=1437193 RepID=UPI00402B84C7
MPKENKSTSRRNRRQCSEVDNEAAASSVRDSLKTVTSSKRYSPFPREIPRKDLKTKQENMMPSIEVLHSMSGGIIESGIKYILFPLHLLRFCIFGTSTKPIASEKPAEPSRKRDEAEKEEKKVKEREEKKTPREATSIKSSEKSGRSKSDRDLVDERKDAVSCVKNSKEKRSRDKDESADEMVTAEEDSDSSGEQWSTANNTLAMNMSIDYDNLDRTMSHRASEEPMDVSMEELHYDKTHIPLNLPRDYRVTEKQFQNNKENIASKMNVEEQDSNSSVDEEISRIFQKQCTSSEDEFTSSFVKSSSFKREKTMQNNFLYYKTNSTVAIHSKKKPEGNAKEYKKKQPSDFSINSKRRKVSHEEDKNERESERRSGNKVREEKRSSRHDTPSKHESRASRTTAKNKETKRNDVKYKEIATQTDSAFSNDDVEMTPIDAKLCNKRTSRRLHFNIMKDKNVERELNYVADTEDSNDGLPKIIRKRISRSSTSSSSTDLGFDERALTTPDVDIVIGRSRTNSLDNTNNFRTRSRPPPGFPELPQNPPLLPYIGNSSKHFIVPRPNPDCPNCSIVPPAPSPMRHLYYDYPEFMDLPVNVSSSKILNNILRNNYYR